jgi:carboxylate-amine ligase
MKPTQFTIGIEEEYMVINPETRELAPHDQKIVAAAEKILPEDQVKAEMHQAVVEAGTGICKSTTEARKDLANLRTTINRVAGDLGFKIGASGTHPFSNWTTQLITDNPRYHQIVKEMQEAARSNLIFGLHVHVGMPNKQLALHIANSMRYFLPHVYALSTNSPFWEGRDTGFKSFRTKVFDKFPRTGIPDYFESWEEYDNYVKLLVKTGCIDNAKKIWWDLRVHPVFDTVEFRICEIPMLLDETLAIAAVFQALCAKLCKLKQQNLEFIHYRRALIAENKWRASRYGLDGTLIDFGKQSEVPTKELILELLDFIDDVVDDLGSRDDINYITKMMEQGTGADRQLKVFYENKNMIELVDFITDSTMQGF